MVLRGARKSSRLRALFIRFATATRCPAALKLVCKGSIPRQASFRFFPLNLLAQRVLMSKFYRGGHKGVTRSPLRCPIIEEYHLSGDTVDPSG